MSDLGMPIGGIYAMVAVLFWFGDIMYSNHLPFAANVVRALFWPYVLVKGIVHHLRYL